MLDEIASTSVHNEVTSDGYRKTIKTPNEVQPVATMNKNPENVLVVIPIEKKVPSSDNLQDQVYE